MVWNRKQRTFGLQIIAADARGQSAVEYILMLAVVASLAATVLNSQMFKDLFGSDSKVFAKFARKIEYTYRHGVNGNLDTNSQNPPFGSAHDTYFKGGQSRFFMPKKSYPE